MSDEKLDYKNAVLFVKILHVADISLSFRWSVSDI